MTHPDYRDRRVIVTGCSSGIGLATARALTALGAEVIGLSRREPDLPLARFVPLDLASVDSIAHAADEIDGPIHAVFSCAGAPPVLPSAELVAVNFLGPRLLIELLIDRMPAGGAVATVTSSNAVAWRERIDLLRAFVAIDDTAAALDWYRYHEQEAGHGYPFGKEALTLWTLQRSIALVPHGIRLNAISPGPVETPLLESARQAFPPEYLAASLQPSGRASTVEEQVAPLLFLNSARASFITGAVLAVDGGFEAVHATAVSPG